MGKKRAYRLKDVKDVDAKSVLRCSGRGRVTVRSGCWEVRIEDWVAMLRCVTVLSCLCIFLHLSARARVCANDEVTRALQAWDSGADAVWSYDVYLSVDVKAYSTITKTLVQAGKHLIRQRFLSGKWRVDLLKTHRFFVKSDDQLWESTGKEDLKSFAFNGKQIRFFSGSDRFGQIQDRMSFYEVKLLAPQLYEMFKMTSGGEPFLIMLGYRAQKASIEADSSAENIVKIDLPVVDLTAPYSLRSRDFKVSLSKNQNWLPIKIMRGELFGKPGPKDVVVTYINEYREYEPGVWAPVRSRIETYARERTGNMDDPAQITTLLVDVDRSRVNIDIHPDVFELAFPPGTIVFDAEKGENYLKTE